MLNFLTIALLNDQYLIKILLINETFITYHFSFGWWIFLQTFLRSYFFFFFFVNYECKKKEDMLLLSLSVTDIVLSFKLDPLTCNIILTETFVNNTKIKLCSLYYILSNTSVLIGFVILIFEQNFIILYVCNVF